MAAGAGVGRMGTLKPSSPREILRGVSRTARRGGCPWQHRRPLRPHAASIPFSNGTGKGEICGDSLRVHFRVRRGRSRPRSHALRPSLGTPVGRSIRSTLNHPSLEGQRKRQEQLSNWGKSNPSPRKLPVATRTRPPTDALACISAVAAARAFFPMPPRITTVPKPRAFSSDDNPSTCWSTVRGPNSYAQPRLPE